MKFILEKIKKLAAYGAPSRPSTALRVLGEGSHGERSRTVQEAWHAITNQVWLWNMLLTAAIVPLVAVLFVVFGDLLGDARVELSC